MKHATIKASNVTQSAFIRAALHPEAAVPEGLVTPDGTPASKRFNVYRNNVVVGLKDALRQGFPTTESLVGADFFDALAGEYIRAHPPKTPMIPLYGSDFPKFLEAFPPARQIPYLPDIARLEYALRESYHAADSTPLSHAALADPLLFTRAVRFAPTLSWFASRYPVTAIHRFVQSKDQTAQPSGTAEDVVITRPGFDPVATGFPPGTGAVLDALATGYALADAAEFAPHTLDLSQFLTTLLTGGAIISIEEAQHAI